MFHSTLSVHQTFVPMNFVSNSLDSRFKNNSKQSRTGLWIIGNFLNCPWTWETESKRIGQCGTLPNPNKSARVDSHFLHHKKAFYCFCLQNCHYFWWLPRAKTRDPSSSCNYSVCLQTVAKWRCKKYSGPSVAAKKPRRKEFARGRHALLNLGGP
jgi:hypothetical protein